MVSKLTGKIERLTLLSLSKSLNALVQVKNGAAPAVIDAAVAGASAAIENLRQLFVRERRIRKDNYQAGKFDIEEVEE